VINAKVDRLTKELAEAKERSEFAYCFAIVEENMRKEEAIQKGEPFRNALGRAAIKGDVNALERQVIDICSDCSCISWEWLSKMIVVRFARMICCCKRRLIALTDDVATSACFALPIDAIEVLELSGLD
jgi:hypothetical protein